MSENIRQELIKRSIDAHAMEKQAIQLLEKGFSIIGDEEVARIFRAHRIQSEEHERHVAERLEAYGQEPSRLKDVAMQGGAGTRDRCRCGDGYASPVGHGRVYLRAF